MVKFNSNDERDAWVAFAAAAVGCDADDMTTSVAAEIADQMVERLRVRTTDGRYVPTWERKPKEEIEPERF